MITIKEQNNLLAHVTLIQNTINDSTVSDEDWVEVFGVTKEEALQNQLKYLKQLIQKLR